MPPEPTPHPSADPPRVLEAAAPAVCVTGMHRSGTSMVARMLGACGFYLGGEDELMPPSSDNPDGFFEHLGVVGVNEALLAELGGGWDCPPPMPEGWERADGLAHERTKAEEIVGSLSRRGGPWGWKDPRTSLTLPFWRSLVPGLRVVVCVRNPLEVALSLRLRNHFSYALGLTLWEAYYRLLLGAVPEGERLLTHYDRYFREPREELERVLGFLGLEAPEEAVEGALSVASTGMRHNWFSGGHLAEFGVSPQVRESYARMCEEADWADGGAPLGTANGWGEGERAMAGEGSGAARGGIGGVDGVALEAELLRRELEAARAELAARGEVIEGLRQELEAVRTEAAGRTAEAERLEEGTQGLKNEVARLAALLRREHEENEAERLAEGAIEAGRPSDGDATIPKLRRQLAEVQGRLDKEIQGRREALRPALTALPAEAAVILVSEGADELLDLDGRRGLHFPQNEDGSYADRFPTDGTAAIAHLEALRARGGDYLLFSGAAFRWLERNERFGRYLRSRYRVVVQGKDDTLVFALRQSAASDWPTEFEEVVAQCRARLEREPTILDHNTGLGLGDIFSQYAVFSPPAMDKALPYLDRSIDIVVGSSDDPASLSEARRVANAAVVTLAGTETTNGAREDAGSGLKLLTEWRLEEGAVALPTASIIVPTYNGVTHTETCLAALRETLPPDFAGEIIVVDDASTDETADVLEERARSDERLKVLRNPENAGFIASCNRGAGAATGEIVVFLNNDTIPLPGWLMSLLQTFHDHPDAGAVGGKLVYPDGTLQEAGGVIFADGSGANFGRGDREVDAPLYSYVREVDYCSGALLATRRSLFEEIGGFDTRYRPAYYEDTDYCFAVRERGFRVYYQPESAIVHLEGATSGTDLSGGVKRYQVVNREKFVEKWARALERQRPRPDHYSEATWFALAAPYEPHGTTSR